MRYEDTLPDFSKCDYFDKRRLANMPMMNPATPKQIDERKGILGQLKEGEYYD